MLAKVQAFNTENNQLPLKAAGMFVGAAIGAAVVFVALSLIADEEEEYMFEAVVPTEESE